MDTGTDFKNEGSQYEIEEILQKETYGTDVNYKHKYLWPHVVVHSALQIGWLIGLYAAFFYAKTATIFWGFFIGFIAAEGTGLGAHRGASHKSFKASTPLRVALMLSQTIAGQNSTFTWARDHILHHKYSDTDADPHNSNRGFFFAHMGWLMMKKHPLLRQKQREMDVSDLLQDKILMFQHKYFLYLYFPLAVFFPVMVPIYFWNETMWTSFFVVYCCQYVTNLHITWTINSFAHLWGAKPYDKRIRATESLISSIVTLGEGWHNFHHAFPWDYRMGEKFSLSAKVLELLAYFGLAYDLKLASPKIIQGHTTRHASKSDRQILAEEVVKIKRERKNAVHTT
ncbi:Acyl-CoA Delta(11) desaturase [Dufourea novaeangliae]|uniref:Acyl-CoA Delta(11) desaturase n=1 Tax=Dufourea novaeangliae TaxID=178035 RepID=A0A154PQ84_DUFNO|nr:Acyl-CoA Delta(11) desaturase [Dufourea novaeangliae]